MENYLDASFSKDFTHHYSLLLQIESHQFVFVLYEKLSGKLIAYKKISLSTAANTSDFINKLKTAIIKEDLLHLPTYEQKICFCNGGFTLVPTILFDEKNSEAYMQLNTITGTDESISTNYIRKIFVKNIFAIQNDIKNYFLGIYPYAKFFHITTPLLEWCLQHKENFAKQQIVLDIKQHVFHIIYFENSEFKYINQFAYQNKEDFLYFLLLVCDDMQIDRTSADLKLSGEIVPDSQLFTECWKFFANISFTQNLQNYKLPDDMASSDIYFYNSMLSLHLCE